MARGETVRASAHDWALFNLHSSNDFIEEVRRGLLTQCPNSNITGIYTKYESFNYLGVVKRVVTSTGFCNREDAPPETLDPSVGGRSDTVNGSDAGTGTGTQHPE